MITSGTDFGIDCASEDVTTVDPMVLLRQWVTTDGDSPPLMALATIDDDGYPRVRHVLLSECVNDSLYFHTDSRSAKVSQLESTPRAAATVAWPAVGRQFVAHGDVRVADDEELRRVYARRARYLQVLAWQNDAAHAAMPVEERRRAWADFDSAHPTMAPPPTWTGYALTPAEVTFWRGDPAGPSQRIRFRRAGTEWHSEVLPG